MPAPKGTKYRIAIKPDGTRIRYGIYNGRIIESRILSSRKRSRAEKRLAKKRRR